MSGRYGDGANGERRLSRAALALAVAAAALALVIVAGTVYALAAGTRARKLERESLSALAAEAGGSSYWTVGTVRAKSSGPEAAVVVATIAFPYDAKDLAFAEELERKAPALKAAAAACLSGRRSEELAPAYEGAVKAALRDSFNALLSLGEVDELWLSDFAVIQ